ncbi:holin [uncultured Mediterranea sp.]|uniref:holin n=1 Tax=uncultured Mediterranea sp. TaxID=1926662 RepID=UPI00280565C6|nr:holin [uncultured Mediterranea sp.]
MADTVQNNKKIAKNTLLLYIRMILLMGISLYTSRIVLNQLGVDDYGIYNVVGGIIVVLSFLNGAMAGATQRFMNVEMGRRDMQALRRVFSTSIHIHIMVSVIILILAETIGLWFLNTQMNIPSGRMYAAQWVYQLSVASAIVGIVSIPFNAAIIAHEKMSAFAYISIFEGTMKLLIAFSLMMANVDKLILYATLIFIVGIINRIIYGIYCSRHFEECRNTSWDIDRPMMRQMLSFSGWTIFGNLGYILHTQGIAIVINLFFNVAVNAAQGIANQINGIVTQFVSNFLTALNPQVVKTYAAGELDNMHNLIIRGCKIAFCLLAFFVIPLVLEAPTILSVWLGVVPEYAVLFVRLVLIISLCNSFSGLLATAKGATGDIKNYQITLTTIGAFHVPLAWLAFELGCGPEYSMYIYLIIVVILQIVRVWFVCNSLHLSKRRLFVEVVMRCLGVFVMSLILPIILHYSLSVSLLSTILICFTSMTCVVIATLFFALTRHERDLLISFVANKIKRQ